MEAKVTSILWVIEVMVPDGLTSQAATRLDKSVEASVYELVDQVPEDVHLTLGTEVRNEWVLEDEADVDEFIEAVIKEDEKWGGGKDDRQGAD